ncbi:MAG TPA: hypothetical protein VMM13_01760, partial [Euzebya sp.]|nr:hypothetical protein [Euzebya sp.]
MVDWSAASWPGPADGRRDGLWAAIAEPGVADRAQPFRTRAEAAGWIQQQLARLLDAGHHVLCGVDFALGFPSGTAAALGAPSDAQAWRWVWQLLDEAIEDDPVNRNNRFDVASRLNARLGRGVGPFWGCPPDSAG